MFKSRLVSESFSEIDGSDYNAKISLVVKHCTIMGLMNIVNQYSNLKQMDVKIIFLHKDLE